MRRLFVLVVAAMTGCDQPSPEEVIGGFCLEHPDYQACSNQSLEEQLLAFCFEYPEFDFCRQSDSSAKEGSEPDSPHYLIASGAWDDRSGHPFWIASDTPHCYTQDEVDGIPGFQINDLPAQVTSTTYFSVVLRGRLYAGVHAVSSGTPGGPPWIDILVGVGWQDMRSHDHPPVADRAVVFEELGEDRARGYFYGYDLCMMGVEEPSCAGNAIGMFDCQIEFDPIKAQASEG